MEIFEKRLRKTLSEKFERRLRKNMKKTLKVEGNLNEIFEK